MRFPAEAVRQHAAAVSEAAGQLELARSTVREVTMDSQAYGEVCRFLPGLLSPLFGGAVEVLNGAVDALSETAFKLRAAAEVIENADFESARHLTESARGPGSP
ncbi:type VII secretion target [Actinoplanes oblitus]|uniref:Type VII secretion target n=1 Tax=Actinoplanes oblitus TaxID=3040509 RepID=A0ABY8W8K2_9ACTN|nr:type VII secretion target [Actinoplanes oblitus]WIM93998.1 type VII secretion target [Actinoplanes oblitus]